MHIRGRVLDIGCNAGRHAVYLQGRRHAVVGIDVSPLAIKTARLRGLKQAHVMSIAEVTPQLGMFDTILMLGNNFGLFGSAARARRLLRRFTRLTTLNARLIAESRDIYHTDEPLHRRYHAMNRRRGRTAGQIRMRARYKNLVSPWLAPSTSLSCRGKHDGNIMTLPEVRVPSQYPSAQDLRGKMDHTPLRRLGQVEDVAMACVFLASDAAAFITGHTLFVDGGLSIA